MYHFFHLRGLNRHYWLANSHYQNSVPLSTLTPDQQATAVTKFRGVLLKLPKNIKSDLTSLTYNNSRWPGDKITREVKTSLNDPLLSRSVLCKLALLKWGPITKCQPYYVLHNSLKCTEGCSVKFVVLNNVKISNRPQKMLRLVSGSMQIKQGNWCIRSQTIPAQAG